MLKPLIGLIVLLKELSCDLETNEIFLIAGKGHETSQTIGIETLPFDDYTVAKESIKNINNSRKAD